MEETKQVKTSCKLIRSSRNYELKIAEGETKAGVRINFEKKQFGASLSNGEQNYGANFTIDLEKRKLTGNYLIEGRTGEIEIPLEAISPEPVSIFKMEEKTYLSIEDKPTASTELPIETQKPKVSQTFVLSGESAKYASDLLSLMNMSDNIKEWKLDRRFTDPNDRRIVDETLKDLESKGIVEINEEVRGKTYHILDKNVLKVDSNLFSDAIKEHVKNLKRLVSDGKISKSIIAKRLLKTRGDMIGFGRAKKQLIEKGFLEEEKRYYKVLKDLNTIV